jgi:ABC-type nitrate/sulfonate/bicarbonate transport system substrate-binding protein
MSLWKKSTNNQPNIGIFCNGEIFMNSRFFSGSRSIPILFTLLAMMVSGCGAGKVETPTTVAPKDKVNVQLSWFHSAEFIGFYTADQLGYYNEENLDVTLTAGSPETDPVALVASNAAQFGVASGDALIQAKTKGQDLVAVSSIFRKSPLIIMALTDKQINTPQDLVGKTVGVISTNLDTTWDIQFVAMLKKLKIDPSDMTFVLNEKYHGAEDLLSGRMDASSGAFSTNELVQAKVDGQAVTSIYYRDYGVEFYNNTIFTNAATVSSDPGLVARFVRATLRGYQYAIEHPQEAAAFTVKYDPELNVELQQATIEAQIPLIDTGDAPIGWMDEDIWVNTQEILLDQGYIAEPVDIPQIYTNDFIKK